MNRRQLLGTAAAAWILAPLAARAAALPAPPVTVRKPVRIEQLGRVRIDEYGWLRDPDFAQVLVDPAKMQPEIRAHLEAENAYAAAVLAPTRPRQKTYLDAMMALAGGDVAPPPTPDGDWDYYSYVRPGEDHPVHARRSRTGGDEQVLLDEQARAKGHAYFRILQGVHSPDHSLFVWSEDVAGADGYSLCVRDLRTGEIHTRGKPDVYGWQGVVVSPCSQWIFWIQRDQYARPAKLFRRPARGGADILVYEHTDPALFMSVGRTVANSFTTIHISGPDLDEWRLIPAADPAATPRLVEPRQPGLHYRVEDWGGKLVILTDADGAIDGKLMLADPAKPGKADWRPWVDHRPGANILEMQPFRDHFVRLQRQDGKLEIVVTGRDRSEKTLAFDEQAYAVAITPDQEHDGARLRLLYQSPRTPQRWIDCDLATGARTVIKATSPGVGFSPEAYEVIRLSAPASDGALVPVTVLMKAGTKFDGASPLLLTGYGAYGVSTEAEFSIPALALVDQGWIFAIAHVRGGSEKGRQWFLDGRKFKKKNSFTDFIASAEHLIAKGYTRPRRIVAWGLSAGGLLMGGVVNLRPDLWAGVIAQVPFVDMLNTMSDATHPLVPAFRPDWGDPLADPQAYDYIASISPYENVTRQAYPPILATAGVRDPRVSYWEPAKWVANLRHNTTGKAPILFEVNMAAGHQASGGLADVFGLYAKFWAFADDSLAWQGRS
ncbi:MAG: S9 family peptidase [Pseudomonadota bacterium]